MSNNQPMNPGKTANPGQNQPNQPKQGSNIPGQRPGQNNPNQGHGRNDDTRRTQSGYEDTARSGRTDKDKR